MQKDEVVLSDVHLATTNADYGVLNYNSVSIKVVISRFTFRCPSHGGFEDDSTSTNEVEDVQGTSDKDGDLDVKRRPLRHLMAKYFALTIEHSLASPLSMVGLQVWNGALLLCDFIIHQRQQFRYKTVLELGAGTGLCSIVAAIFAGPVFCTDYDLQVLQVAQRNVDRNQDFLHPLSTSRANSPTDGLSNVRVRKLDWTNDDPFAVCSGDCDSDGSVGWTVQDAAELNKPKILLAADVIYDDHLTDNLFNLVSRLLCGSSPTVMFLTLEKRLNFTLDELDVCCPAYEHFLSILNGLQTKMSADVQQLPLDFPTYFDYQRNSYLELWKIAGGNQGKTVL